MNLADLLPSEDDASDATDKDKVKAAAAKRLETQGAALVAAGLNVGKGQFQGAQWNGVAKVQVGTVGGVGSNMAVRLTERMKDSVPIEEAAAKLRNAVLAERREDVAIKAGDFHRGIDVVDGKVTFMGHRLREQAIRGLLGRIDSPALRYVLGLRDRIAEGAGEGRIADLGQIAEVLRFECRRAPNVDLVLRTRRSPQDVYAVVSPGYGVADAPETLDEVMGVLRGNVTGRARYDAPSTAWTLEAEVWNPTPAHEQAVGEAFRGFVAFQSKDNGTGCLRGNGGIEIWSCSNAATYSAADSSVRRVHRGNVLRDVRRMLKGGLAAIDTLVTAWGTARDQEVELKEGVPIDEAMPEMWQRLLTDRQEALAGFLPGRSAEHAKGLTAAFHAERRDKSRVVRADLAQAWTRYIQGQPAEVRQDAEQAIGAWLVG